MTYESALKHLGIIDYSDRIFNSNSRGELMHLLDYIAIAESINNDSGWFRKWFESVVVYAEQNSDRPESVFQHIFSIFISYVQKSNK